MLAVLGVLLTGISKSGFAGGAGVVAVPLLALVMPVAQATALVLPLLLVMDARSISYYLRHINKAILWRIIPGAIAGIAAGGLLLGVFSDAVLSGILGVLCVVFAVWQSIASRLAKWRGAGWFWSVSSGLSSTLLHAGGPPINIYMLSLRLPKLQWLATTAVFFGVMNVVKIIPYTLNGQWAGTMWWQVLLLLPVALFGVFLGKRLQERISEQWFMRFCRLLLFGSGMLLIKPVLFA